MKEKILTMIVFITIILLIFFAYRPISVDAEYNGIYFDKINEDFNENIYVHIVGIVKKNFFLQPESFAGMISIDSCILEIMKPRLFDKYGKVIGLSLSDDDDMTNVWKFTGKGYLFDEFEGATDWSIRFDKKFSMISFVLFFNDGTLTSSRREISAPCDNREEAIRIARYLKSGGISVD